MDIHILPSNIANMIAAGEVVQRPSSVVKELMENALDAGADKVDVILADSGRTLIRVIDNGCGMTGDQASLCFERHATSKISSEEDLRKIMTFGFRGEALASIAAVAEIAMTTRTANDELATLVTISNATLLDAPEKNVGQTSAPKGTSISVKNLFYNTPARRKFLKSDAAELKSCILEFTKLALARPDVSFSIVNNEREIYRLGHSKGLKYRIQELFGDNAANELVEIKAETSVVNISGFLSRPEDCRKKMSNQFLFVNGRFFRSPYLNKAVQKAYENLIVEGNVPSYFIFLDIDPSAIDVNVHPAKTEIKFEDDGLLFNTLWAASRESLGRNSLHAVLDFENGDETAMPRVSEGFEKFNGIDIPSSGIDTSFNPFDETPSGGDNSSSGNRPGWYSGKPSLTDADISALFDGMAESRPEETQHKILVSGRYIFAKTKDSVMVVNAHNAAQRIMYERFIKAFSSSDSLRSASLFPVEVEIGAANMPLLEQHAELLGRIGFEISQISPVSVSVSSVPEGLSNDKMTVSALLFEALCALESEKASLAGAVFGAAAERLAKSASRCVAVPADDRAANEFIAELMRCENPDFTPDGHKTIMFLDDDVLNKMFK